MGGWTQGCRNPEEAVFGRDLPEHHEHLGAAINNLGVAYC